MPGVGEIRRTARELASFAADNDLALMELFGDLPLDQQQAVLRPADRRKIVLATNVAETSVTIEGITGVVDSGLARINRLDPALGDQSARRVADLAGVGRSAGRPRGTNRAGRLLAALD